MRLRLSKDPDSYRDDPIFPRPPGRIRSSTAWRRLFGPPEVEVPGRWKVAAWVLGLSTGIVVARLVHRGGFDEAVIGAHLSLFLAALAWPPLVRRGLVPAAEPRPRRDTVSWISKDPKDYIDTPERVFRPR